MVYGIVKNHDGLIDIESEPGLGTTVRLYLPALLQEEYHSGSGVSSGSTSSARNLAQDSTILVVEDDTLLLDGLIISMAAAAVVGALMDTTFLHGIEASTTVISLKVAYPLGSVILLSFSIWVLALSGWRPNRTWIAAVGGFALTGIASTAFLLQTVKGDYTPGTFLDSLWLGGGLMLAYAAWQPHEEPTPVRLEGESRMTATSLHYATSWRVRLSRC